MEIQKGLGEDEAPTGFSLANCMEQDGKGKATANKTHLTLFLVDVNSAITRQRRKRQI